MADQNSDSSDIILSAEEVDDVVSQFRLRTSNRRPSHQQMQKFFGDLPRLTEADLTASGDVDGVCPICFNTLLAILAKEEMALAMDTPAHAVEELGVTRLHRTCGHLFCRKDIIKWVMEGHVSCPSCRRPFIADAQLSNYPLQTHAGNNWLGQWVVDSNMVPRGPIENLPILPLNAGMVATNLGRHGHANSRHDTSMYS
ncbi:hypothetical protein F5I97DRAFT_893392 [Phlebopus sp. FC_14]|nr:hypothetical protein F5I97DRAFT_893392 [Phlebopus sp. FC_14]